MRATRAAQARVPTLVMCGLLTLLVLATACGERSAAPELPRPTSTTIRPMPATIERNLASVIGDSLIASTTGEQIAAISALGYRTTVQALPGAPLAGRFIQESIQIAKGSGVVVIATATNDNYSNYLESLISDEQEAQRLYRDQLRRATEQLAGSCVVWVNTRTAIGAFYHPETTGATNRTLAQFVASEPRTRLVDWAAISAPHDQTDWFIADELHFNLFHEDEFGLKVQDDSDRRQAGADAYAAAIAEGVARCPRP